MSNFNKSLYFMTLKQSYPRTLSNVSNKYLRWSLKFVMLPYFAPKALLRSKSKKIIIAGFILQITEWCNLKCEACSILIPYIKNPKHKPAEVIFSDMEKLLELIDYLPNVRLIGGETLLHPELYEIIKWLCKNKKVGVVTLVTNGTLLFDDNFIPLLQNKKVFVLISDYGKLSIKIHELVDMLGKNKIGFSRVPFESWMTFGGTEFRNYSEKQLITMYKNCPIKLACMQFFDKKLAVCSRGENLFTMGIDHTENTNGILDISNISSKKEMGDKLNELYSLKYISACNYCSLGTKASAKIPPAIQIKEKRDIVENTSN